MLMLILNFDSLRVCCHVSASIYSCQSVLWSVWLQYSVVPDLYVTDPHEYGVLVFVALDSFSRSSSKALFL